MSLSIDIGVGGRFHADRMAETFANAHHDVRLVTSFPRSRFPALDPKIVKPILWPEIAYRARRRLGREIFAEEKKMRAFGRRLARRLARSREPRDLFVGWSSFSLETLRLGQYRRTAVVRDSAHIRAQMRYLDEAYRAAGLEYPRRPALIAREEAEYAAADEILVISEFARQTFLAEGVPARKISVIPLGVDLSLFHPTTIRISKRPLRVIYFGALSLQKGVHTLLEATRHFPSDSVELTLVGGVEKDFTPVLARYDHAVVLPALPQPALASLIRRQHVCVLPSFHDGFGMVVAQAMASGIVPIVSDRAGSKEIVADGESGFHFPAGDVAALRDLILTLAARPATREALARAAHESIRARDWKNYGDAILSWAEGR